MPPFTKETELVLDSDHAGTTTHDLLSNHPVIQTSLSSRAHKSLENEFWCRDLEVMAPRLWIMTTYSSANVNPLHRQRVKGREIVITEEPRLHLVWIHNRIFIKPLPRYLLSYDFWRSTLEEGSDRVGYKRSNLCEAATGFLRTYRYLIQHESDFHIAQQDHLRLIPKDLHWSSFSKFLSELDHIEDADVSMRYHYGELRLTRLNFYAPLLLGKFHYEQVHGQYGAFFGRLYGPILFAFAMVTTILNSMQVALAVDQVETSHWETMWHVSRYFSIISLFGATVISLWLMVLWLWLFLDEWIFTIRKKREKRQTAQTAP